MFRNELRSLNDWNKCITRQGSTFMGALHKLESVVLQKVEITRYRRQPCNENNQDEKRLGKNKKKDKQNQKSLKCSSVIMLSLPKTQLDNDVPFVEVNAAPIVEARFNANELLRNVSTPLLQKNIAFSLGFEISKFAELGTLADFFNKNQISHSQFVKLIGQIVIVLDELHKKNIVHGDLKPWNILVYQNGLNDFQIALIDFDTLKQVNDRGVAIKSYLPIHTPEFVPDGICLERDNLKAADYYALGKTLEYLIKEFRIPTNSLLNDLINKLCNHYKKLSANELKNHPFFGPTKNRRKKFFTLLEEEAEELYFDGYLLGHVEPNDNFLLLPTAIKEVFRIVDKLENQLQIYRNLMAECIAHHFKWIDKNKHSPHLLINLIKKNIQEGIQKVDVALTDPALTEADSFGPTLKVLRQKLEKQQERFAKVTIQKPDENHHSNRVTFDEKVNLLASCNSLKITESQYHKMALVRNSIFAKEKQENPNAFWEKLSEQMLTAFRLMLANYQRLNKLKEPARTGLEKFFSFFSSHSFSGLQRSRNLLSELESPQVANKHCFQRCEFICNRLCAFLNGTDGNWDSTSRKTLLENHLADQGLYLDELKKLIASKTKASSSLNPLSIKPNAFPFHC